jgi:hypothetical protein
MELNNNIIPMNSLGAPKTPGKRFIRSLEYEVLANLTLQQFTQDDVIDFAQLLALPMKNRIPGLAAEYGNKRMHRMITLILKEFVYSVKLPKSKKLTDTKINVCACDLMLAAYEDQMGMEDLVVFFERAKKGKYGSFGKLLTHFSIMQKLEFYRQARHEAYVKIMKERETERKAEEKTERIAPEPTAINNLFGDENIAKVIPMKRIS